MSSGIEGRSLELYFIDGRPDGMHTAEVFNWTGHVLMAPRTRLSDMLARREANYTGVYILLGEIEGEPRAYIGEGEDISFRIKNHDAKKDWWTQAVLVTSTANNLHKAHVRYLEARLIEEASSTKRIALENGTAPSRSSLSESAQSNMESFLDYLFMVLPALRVDMFVKSTRPSISNMPSAAPLPGVVFELNSKLHKLKAVAVLDDGDFIAQSGSMARLSWSGVQSGYADLFANLVKQGILVSAGDHNVFTKSYAFDSTSAAAAVVSGRSANGTTEWKVKGTNQTYKEWEAAQLGNSSLEEYL